MNIKQVDEKTRAKTSVNDLLRDQVMLSYAIQLAQDGALSVGTPAEGGALNLMQDELGKLGLTHKTALW